MKKLTEQIVSFIVVGGIATVIDLLVVYILYQQLGINYLVACTLAFALATLFNYWASMRYTFVSKYHAQQKHREFILFLVLSLVGLGLTLLLMKWTVEGLLLPVMFAKIGVTGCVMVFNFVTRKLLLEAR